jgi:hypothetical protein
MPVKPEPPLSSSPAQAGDPNVLLSKETRSFMPRSFIKRSIKVFLKGGLYLGIEWILIYARKINVKGGELVLDGSLKTAGT